MISSRALAIVVLVMVPLGHGQTTLHVPAGFPTIQAAINFAASGDTVLVAPGTWVGNVDFLGKDVTVVSAQGAGVTTIQAATAVDIAVTFESGEGLGAVLDGFTVSGYHGIRIDGPTTTPGVLNCIVELCVCGILIESGAQPQLDGCTVRLCANGEGDGGGISVTGAGTAPVINGCTVHDCLAGRGGGVSFGPGTSVILTGSTLHDNAAISHGGALWAEGATLNVSTVTFDDNVLDDTTAPLPPGGGAGVGGAIALQSATLNLSNSSILDSDYVPAPPVPGNPVPAPEGGAIYSQNSTISLIDCTVAGNHCFTAGCMATYGGTMTMIRTVIENNVADMMWVVSCANLTMRDCVVRGNTAYFGPTVESANLDVANSYFTDNTNDCDTAGVSGSGIVVNSTIANNSVVLGTGYSVEGANLALTNCIVWNNFASGAPANVHPTHPLTVTYCAVPGGHPGTGNVDLDPAFADPANGDYHLTPFSAIVDRGDSTVAGLPVSDPDGDARIEGGAVDIGADELPGGRTGLGLDGTGDDLVLSSLVDGAGAPGWPVKAAGVGSFVLVGLDSPGQTFTALPALIGIQSFTTGTPVIGPPTLPAAHLDPFGALLVVGVPVLPVGGTALTGTLPWGLTGLTFRAQAAVNAPQAANGVIALTDAHDIVVL